MSQHKTEHALPAKCEHCDRPMSDVVVCDYCKGLNHVPAATDYFTLLGLPRRFDIDRDVLQQKFVAISRHAHPDFHAGESPEVQRLALQVSSAVNDAYRTLKEPAGRAGYLLELLGGKSSAEDKSVPDGFLGTAMMMQEELAEAKASSDLAETERLRVVLRTQHDGLLRRIAALYGQYEEAASCEAVRKEFLQEIRKLINAVSYVKKLMSQLP